MSSANSHKTAHALELLESTQKMRSSESICDFTIKVGDERLFVHKTVVAACAPYFLAMFTSKLEEENEGEVDMKDVQPFAVKLVIDYMYTGEVNLDANSAEAVLQTADLMQMLTLKDVCLRYLIDNITTENCFEVKRLAKLYSSPQFVEKAEEYIEKHFTDLPETEDFLDLTLDEMQRYAKKLGHNSSDVWKAGSAWVRHDTEGRTQHLHDLLKSFYVHFDFAFLFQTVLEDPMVKACEESRKLLLDRLFSHEMSATRTLTDKNCYKMYELAKEYDSSQVKKGQQTTKVLSYMADLFLRVAAAIRDANIYRPLQPSQRKALTAIRRGVYTWCSSHEDDVLDFLKTMALEDRKLDFLLDNIWTEQQFMRIAECGEYVADIILSKEEALNIKIKNFFTLSKISQSFEHPRSVQVKYAVEEYMSRYITQVVKDSRFVGLSKDDLWTMFKRSPQTGMENQVKCDAALKWASHNVTERAGELPRLLRAINLSEIPVYNMKKLREHQLITQSLECMGIIMDNLLGRCEKYP